MLSKSRIPILATTACLVLNGNGAQGFLSQPLPRGSVSSERALVVVKAAASAEEDLELTRQVLMGQFSPDSPSETESDDSEINGSESSESPPPKSVDWDKVEMPETLTEFGCDTDLWNKFPLGAKKDLTRFVATDRLDLAEGRIESMKSYLDFVETPADGMWEQTSWEAGVAAWEKDQDFQRKEAIRLAKEARRAAAKAKREAAALAKAAAEQAAAKEAAEESNEDFQ